MIDSVVRLAEEAGRAILGVYSAGPMEVRSKEDLSPLTLADTASHRILVEGLKLLRPEWPVLSEESRSVPYAERKTWQTYWLVDPLDGTKEFIKKNGEFTVNIALMRKDEPILGVVHAPSRGVTYFAERGKGAFKKEPSGRTGPIRVRRTQEKWKVVVSRSHAGDELERFLEHIGPFESVSVGSALKLCLVAEGQAHFYPRFWPSMEWDIAAGQCVVLEAGGSVCDREGRTLSYNKQELVNPHFLASAFEKGSFPW